MRLIPRLRCSSRSATPPEMRVPTGTHGGKLAVPRAAPGFQLFGAARAPQSCHRARALRGKQSLAAAMIDQGQLSYLRLRPGSPAAHQSGSSSPCSRHHSSVNAARSQAEPPVPQKLHSFCAERL